MKDSLVLGRVAGIPIGINWSLLVAVALVAWTLATGILPAVHPGLSDSTYLIMALVAAVAYFASILLHELGHAMVARREGMPIAGITLWIFGGVAKGVGPFPSARAELRIALGGPAVSLGLGVGLSLFAWAVSLPAGVEGVIAWLGFTNLALLAFNMIPAPPLDGGRVLHALLWRHWNDLARATRVGATIGQGFGLLLIAGGVVMLMFVDVFSGIWFIFLGWFLRWAAEAEAAAVRLPGVPAHGRPAVLPTAPGAVAGRRLSEVVPRAPVLPIVAVDDDVLAVLELMRAAGADQALVRDDGRIVGVVTLADLVRGLSAGGTAAASRG